MSVDDLLHEQETLGEEIEEAVDDYLADLRGFTQLKQRRVYIQAEVDALNDVYGAIAAAGSSVEGDRRRGQTASAMVTLRIRYALEREIVEATILMHRAVELQHLAERYQAVVSELKRRLTREHRDALETFQQLADLRAEFCQTQIANSHAQWREAWRGAIETQRLAAGQLEQVAPGSAASWRFQAPPNWPQPHPDWSPEADWLPDPTWDVPEDRGWHFWTRG